VTPLRRLLAFISVAMVVDTAGYAAITPLLPGFAAEHDLSKSMTGILTAAYPAGVLLLALPSAWVSSRVGAKRTVVGSLALLAAATLGFGFAGTELLLLASRFAQGGAAAALWAGALAWVVAEAPRERRAEAIGTAVGAAIFGSLGGPALGAAAAEWGTEVVFAAFVALPVALIVIARGFPGPPPLPTGGLAALRAAASTPAMRRGLWLMTLPALAFGVLNTLVPLRLDLLGAGATAIGATFLTAAVVEAAAAPVAGRAADRRGALWPARIGLVAGGCALVLVPLGGAALLVAAGVCVAAPLLGMLWTPAMALLTEGAETRAVDPAYGFGLANLGWGTGAMVGAAAAGAIAQVTADAAPFALVAALAVATAAALRPAAYRSAAGQAIR